MGPHSFKCGKKAYPLVHCSPPQGFNGAALFQVRKDSPDRAIFKGFFELQWGRTLSSAERNSAPGLPEPNSRASMGPHSFKCGKPEWRTSRDKGRSRFNGAALFQVRKEFVRSFKGDSGVRCFNGAALFQVRKVDIMSVMNTRLNAASMGPHSFKCGK